MNDEPTNTIELPEGFELPPGFVLPDGMTEIPVTDADYDLALRDLPEVALADVFRQGPRVIWAEVDTEIVLYQLDSDTSFVLNPTSAIAWRCLDGTSPLGEILADIAGAFGVEAQQVENDFTPIMAGWMLDDLVEEVRHG